MEPPVPGLPPELLRTLSPEEVNSLPVGRYEGDVRLVAAPAELERALADILAEEVVGFDTETRPAFRKGESYSPSLAQVATSRAVYLFQVQRQDFSAALGQVLGDGRTHKAGVSLADDLKNLGKLFHFEPRAMVDVGHLARRHGLRQTGVRNLAALLLGIRVPKGAKTTNWAAPRLTPQQIRYAATDAWACRELLLRFRNLGIGT